MHYMMTGSMRNQRHQAPKQELGWQATILSFFADIHCEKAEPWGNVGDHSWDGLRRHGGVNYTLHTWPQSMWMWRA